MPRPTPPLEGDLRTSAQFSRRFVDGVHADDVRAQIGRQNEGTGWVEEDLVRVRRVLLRFGAGVGEFVGEGLEWFLVGLEGEGEC